jgi:hypothetical protein
MSGDFSTVLIKDSTIAGITDKLTYAVQSGASSNTFQKFNAISNGNTSLTFNINVPSENVIVNREVFIKTKIVFTLTGTGYTTATASPGIGLATALQCFPFNHLVTTATAQINNTSVSTNLQDILPMLLQLASQEELSKYNGMTPTLVDSVFQSPSDIITTVGIPSLCNPMNEISFSGHNKFYQPRGAFQITQVGYSRTLTDGTVEETLDVTSTSNVFKFCYEVEVTEPLIGLSPFIYGSPKYNNQGLVGVNSINIVLNIDSTMKRFITTFADTSKITGITMGRVLGIGTDNSAAFRDPAILMNFMTPQSKDIILSRNVVPYIDLPRYIASVTNPSAITAGESVRLTSQNIQLNQIPDLFVIAVRKPMSTQTIFDFEFSLAIKGISINFSNTSGLLSSASPEDLYRMSVDNGSMQSWAQFRGLVNKAIAISDSDTGVSNMPTNGAVLVLSPPYDMSLPDYLTSGSIGNYNFQFEIDVFNQTVDDITPELVVMTVNSGIFTTIAGSSNIYTGILTKQMVMDAKDMGSVNPVMSVEHKRMIGGGAGIFDQALSAVKENPAVREYAKKALKSLAGSGISSGGRISHLVR